MPPVSETSKQSVLPQSGIRWNIITWYSKTLAILLFVVLVCGAFVFGIWYEKQMSAQPEINNLQKTVEQNSATPNSSGNVFAGLPHASTTEGGDWCRNGLFSSDSKAIMLVQVLAASTSLRVDYDFGSWSCPDSDQCSGTQLPVGQELLVNKKMGKFLCAYDPNTDSAGWISVGDVEIENPQPTQNPLLTEWLGDWVAWGGSYKISLSLSGSVLHAEGYGEWKGYSTHEGQFSSDASPAGAQVTFIHGNPASPSEFDCQVDAELVGPYLVVSDNNYCGGMNVSFDGIYTRQK